MVSCCLAPTLPVLPRRLLNVYVPAWQVAHGSSCLGSNPWLGLQREGKRRPMLVVLLLAICLDQMLHLQMWRRCLRLPQVAHQAVMLLMQRRVMVERGQMVRLLQLQPQPPPPPPPPPIPALCLLPLLNALV